MSSSATGSCLADRLSFYGSRASPNAISFIDAIFSAFIDDLALSAHRFSARVKVSRDRLIIGRIKDFNANFLAQCSFNPVAR